jgi:hypothetical protein
MNENNNTTEAPKRAWLTIDGKIGVGFSIATIVALTVAVSLVVTNVPVLGHNRELVVGAFALLGVALFGASIVLRLARKSKAAREVSRSERPLGFFCQAHFWGRVLAISSLPIYLLSAYLQPKAPAAVVAQAKPAPKPEPVQVVETNAPVEEVVAVEFPELKVDGLVCNGNNSTAVINQQTLSIGETVKGVKLVEVADEGVFVELKGQKKFLPWVQ